MRRQDLPHLFLLNMECYDVCELVSNKHKCNSVVPPQEARALQALLVRREAIAQDLQRERNHQEKACATDTPALIHKSLEENKHNFGSAEQLAAYLGLVPVERQLGSSVLGRARMSKAGPARIRAVLYMAAVVGTRYNPHVKAVYERLLARGKSKISSLGAAMRKLAHLSFGVLKTQQLHQHDYLKNA
jgi:hypothetical protein